MAKNEADVRDYVSEWSAGEVDARASVEQVVRENIATLLDGLNADLWSQPETGRLQISIYSEGDGSNDTPIAIFDMEALMTEYAGSGALDHEQIASMAAWLARWAQWSEAAAKEAKRLEESAG